MPQHSELLTTPVKLNERARMTRGERLVDRFIYWGVNFGFNYLMSAAVMDLFMGHKNRAPGETKPTSYFTGLAEGTAIGPSLSKISDNLYAVQKSVDRWNIPEVAKNVVTLSTGGHAAAVAVKLLADRKRQLSQRADKWLDKLTGHVPTPEEIAARDARYAEIDAAPKKTWGRVIQARLLSTMVQNPITFGTLEILDKKLFGKAFPSPYKNGYGIGRITEPLAQKISAPIKRNWNLSENGQRMAQYWPLLALTDVFATANVALGMELQLKLGDKLKTQKAAKAAESEPASAPAERPLSADELKNDYRVMKEYSASNAGKNWSGDRIATHRERSANAVVEAESLPL